CLWLGNLDARRDWGHARDYVLAQWLMLQQPEPDDFVIATGEQRSVRELVTLAARLLDFELEWRGKGLDEQGIDAASGKTIVRIDSRYFRPTEVDSLLGDASKARQKLGWRPETSFESMIQEMIEHDLELAKRDALVASEGYRVNRYHE